MFVPVDAVIVELNVTAPRTVEIVAVLIVAVDMVDVLIVAVEMVAVLAERVQIVAVPVEAVRLPPNVTFPESRLVPSTAKEPVLFTPVVERLNADDVLSPSVIT